MSIGSSTRDHEVEVELAGETFRIRREGTDGDMDAAVARIAELDGEVDAIGLGGVDLYLKAAGRTYVFREVRRMAEAAKTTPTVDGSGLKNSLERYAVRYMTEEMGLELAGKKVLMTAAVDRFGLAEAFHDAGCEMTFGDLVFGLGLPFPIRRWGTFNLIARILLPVIVRLPFRWVYPTGDKQLEESDQKYAHHYRAHDIIAGDFLYVRKYMPEDMTGKWVVTNTTTAADVEELRSRGVELLVTTTPRLGGRSFGTNVMEAAMVALSGECRPLESDEYLGLLRRVGFDPSPRWLQQEGRLPHDSGEAAPVPTPVLA